MRSYALTKWHYAPAHLVSVFLLELACCSELHIQVLIKYLLLR